jgi:hypothetical protein
MPAPKRPWCPRLCRRIVDYSPACLYIQQRAEALFGSLPQGHAGATQMRQHLKPTSDGSTRVLQSAGALRRQHGLWGTAKASEQAYASLHKRTHWRRSRHSSCQRLPIGSGMTEAAGKTVCTQRLKRSGRSWTIAGRQVILDLRVIWLRGVWEHVHQRYLASHPMPMPHEARAQGAQPRQQAA